MPAWNSASAAGSISATARKRRFWAMTRMVEQVRETASTGNQPSGWLRSFDEAGRPQPGWKPGCRRLGRLDQLRPLRQRRGQLAHDRLERQDALERRDA